MTTVISDIEALINPWLSYFRFDSDELTSLSPDLFFRDICDVDVHDCDEEDMKSLNIRLQYHQSIAADLRNLVRSEYHCFSIQQKQ